MTSGLARLAGKTVATVDTGEYDHYSFGNSISEVYRITCTDGTVICIIANDGEEDIMNATIRELPVNAVGNPQFDSGRWIEPLHRVA
jgi:hypothetical protein